MMRDTMFDGMRGTAKVAGFLVGFALLFCMGWWMECWDHQGHRQICVVMGWGPDYWEGR